MLNVVFITDIKTHSVPACMEWIARDLNTALSGLGLPECLSGQTISEASSMPGIEDSDYMFTFVACPFIGELGYTRATGTLFVIMAEGYDSAKIMLSLSADRCGVDDPIHDAILHQSEFDRDALDGTMIAKPIDTETSPYHAVYVPDGGIFVELYETSTGITETATPTVLH